MMEQQQITEALVRKYREEYARYYVMERLAQEALDEGDEDGYRAISRRAQSKSQLMYGIKLAAIALNISEADFMAAVNMNWKVVE